MKSVSILPADSYLVVNKSFLNENDRKLLTTLYQPIIGTVAICLYFTLWSDLNKTNIISNEFTHHHLMNSMGLKLDEIIIARKKLEALGLLKTFFKEGNINNYIYELYSPLSPLEFFSNPILSSSLLASIGKKEYQMLVSYFKPLKLNISEFENITCSFSDIYKMDIKTIEDVTEKDIISKEKNDISINDVLDFDYIKESIPKGILSNNAFSASLIKLLNRLAYLYNFDNDTMIELLKNSINEKGTFNEEKLKKNCKNLFSFENDGVPKLIFKSKNDVKVDNKNIKDIKQKLIECFECTTPYDFLKAKYGGSKPTSKDISLVESLLVDQELNPGVVNVLIDYVLRTNEKKLNKNLVQAIASQWKMCNITTVKDAMKQAEKEYRKINQAKEKKNIKKIETEKLPNWYGKDVKKQEMSKEDIKELENMLSEFV